MTTDAASIAAVPTAPVVEDNAGFLTILEASLRDFEVTLTNTNVVRVSAHLHDGGRCEGRHLSFMQVQPNGEILISHVIHGAVWIEMRDVTSKERLAQFARLKAIEAAGQREERQERYRQSKRREKEPKAPRKRSVH